MTTPAKDAVSLNAAEIERRQRAFDDYVALCRFEGIEFTDEMKADAQRLVNGEMTHEQHRALLTAKYRVRAAAKK